ncbi:MAG TPA: hypothetical protein VJ438_03935 [Candidatus Nanoarchaeia archaeon]|nr:hypothetical protein [Candidatus Nanoarchaeia archaeon]
MPLKNPLIKIVLTTVFLFAGCRSNELNHKIEKIELSNIGKVRYVSRDFDGDGDIDFGLFKKDLEVLYGDTDFFKFYPKDFDNDGDSDMFVVEEKKGKFILYKN